MKKEFLFATPEEQLSKLISQDLAINNMDFAKMALQTYGYYNIINSYKEPYLHPDCTDEKKYMPGVSFEQIFSLFQLDHVLRNSIMTAMLDLEEHLRAISAEIISKYFGTNPETYLNFNNYRDRFVKDSRFSLSSILNDLKKKVAKSNRDPIKYYRDVYDCVPPWVLFKDTYLSTLVNFIRLFKKQQKIDFVCKIYGVPPDIAQMDSVINLMTDTLFICLEYRNLAAHGGRVYNYIPNSKTRLNNKSSRDLENLIDNFNDRKNSYGLASLLFLLNLFKYKQPFEVIRSTLIQEVNRHCNIYPQDVPILANITGTQISQEYTVWISKTSKKYHSNPFCSGLSNQFSIPLDEAERLGYEPCKRCN